MEFFSFGMSVTRASGSVEVDFINQLPRAHQLQNLFTPKHKYCTQANNSCARVAIHKLQFIQASNSGTPGSNPVTQIKRIFYVTLNEFRS
jgi:hypothetical protein